MKQSRVAIIIINWNSFSYTNDCLNSLNELEDECDVVIVDNASTDDSLIMLREYHPDIHYVENEENLGFTGGNNQGMAYALERNFEFILLLNNDTFVEKNFLSVLVGVLDNNPGIGAVQPKIFYNHDRNLIWHAGGKYFPAFTHPRTLGNNKVDAPEFNVQKEVDWVTGCALLVKTEVVRKVGLLNDLFFYGGYDDVDWSLRIRKAGFKLFYCPKSIIYHVATVASKTDQPGKEGLLRPYFHYLINRNQIILMRLHTSLVFKFTSYLYQFLKFGAYSFYFLVRNRPRKLRAFVHGFFHGFTKPLVPESLKHKHYIQLYKE